jgi:CBS domain-containing protein
MPQRVSDVMTPEPFVVRGNATIQQAAQIMRQADIGNVVVIDHDEQVSGIVTDRDLVLRALAEGLSPDTSVDEVRSGELIEVTPDTPAAVAVELMRSNHIRRLPVLDSGRLVGIVSLGDLAVERDPESALAEISSAPPNN